MADEVARALQGADDTRRRAIEDKRAVVQQAVARQDWDAAITAMEALRGFLRELKGLPTTPPPTRGNPALKRARETWRSDVDARLKPVRADAGPADGRRLDALRKEVDAAFADDDMQAAGAALEALDEAIPEVATATRARIAHEKAVRERRGRADRVLSRLESSRDRASPDELKRLDSLRFPISEAFASDQLPRIDAAIDALETALAEVDPAIVARDRALDVRHDAAVATLDLKKALGFPLDVTTLDKLAQLAKSEQRAGRWESAGKALAALEDKVAKLSADMAVAVLLESNLAAAEDAADPIGFDLRQIRADFTRTMKGSIQSLAAELPKLGERLAREVRRADAKRNAGPAVPPDAADIAIDRSEGRPKLPGSGIFLSQEMIRNLAGERGAEHKVPLDVLDYAAKKSKGKSGATDGGHPAFYYPVGPGKGCSKFLCIVIDGGTMITSYTITTSDMARKLGVTDAQLREWAAPKAYTRNF